MSIVRMREKFANYLKPVLIAFGVILIIGAAFQFGGGSMGGKNTQGTQNNDVVATVNGQNITSQDYDAALADQLKALKDQLGYQYNSLGPVQMASIKSRVLSNLIQTRAIMLAAQQQNISVGYFERRSERNKMIDEAIKARRDQLQGGRKKPLSDNEFERALANSRPPMTVDSLRAEVEAKLTPDVVDLQITANKLIAKINSSVGPIDDSRLKDSYRVVKVQQAIIGMTGMADAQAKRKAEEVLKKAKSGEDFGNLITQNSDMKDTTAHDMPVMMDPALMNIKDGQISGVLKSPYGSGYRVVKVLSSTVSLPKDFDKNKKKLRDDLKKNLENQAMSDFQTNLNDSLKVDVKDPELRGYYFADKATAQIPMDMSDRKKYMNIAIESLSKATRQSGSSPEPFVKLAMLYAMDNKNDDALAILTDILDTRKIAEGADLRVMHAGILMSKKDNAKYKDQVKNDLGVACDMAAVDQNPQLHDRILQLAKQAGLQDVVTKELQWKKDHPQQPQMGMPIPQPTAKPAAKPAK